MKILNIQLNNYQKELDNVEIELQKLPEGRLVKRGEFYCQRVEYKEVGITRKTNLIRALCRKIFLLNRKEELIALIDALSSYVNLKEQFVSIELTSKLPPAYQDFPENYFYHPSVESFIAKGHSPSDYKPESRHYHSNNGVALRSKSEMIIANELEAYGIPYRYEAPLRFGEQVKYPDFTIKNPFNGKVVIWEHFGALHESGYENNMNEKMLLYTKHHYRPFETIIYTFEFDTKNIRRIRELIEQVILG